MRCRCLHITLFTSIDHHTCAGLPARLPLGAWREQVVTCARRFVIFHAGKIIFGTLSRGAMWNWSKTGRDLKCGVYRRNDEYNTMYKTGVYIIIILYERYLRPYNIGRYGRFPLVDPGESKNKSEMQPWVFDQKIEARRPPSVSCNILHNKNTTTMKINRFLAV